MLSRDGMGRITSRQETVGGVTTTYAYSYWPMGRLKQVDVNGVCAAYYTYDANGNRLSAACGDATPTAECDSQDRMIANGAATYGYSLSGRLESKTGGTDTTSYVYDGLGNLLTLVQPDGTQIDYAVDARGRRIGKLVNSMPVKSWLYADSLRPVAELDDAGNLRLRFVYASERNVPDYMTTYASDGTVSATYRLKQAKP